MNDGELSRSEREAMLEKANRPATLIGVDIPETVRLGGESVPLRSVVHSLTSVPSPEDASIAEARRLAGVLEQEADSLADSLRLDPDLTRAKADSLYGEIVGLRRAASDLRSVGRRRGFGAETVTRSEIEDAKRWIEFMKALR